MNGVNIRSFFILIFVFIFCSAGSQTLIMNEVSNGPAGNQEYVEFVVVSNSVSYNCANTTPPCIDIRGWIFDDNSGYHGAGGVASGAVRFSQNALWSCVPLGTIILIYNNADRNPAIPPDDISMADGNCTIIAPINNASLFESNATTPGAIACSYPAAGWTAGGSWNNTLLANPGDCARIVNLAGCEVFSVCWGSDNTNNLIYFSGAGGQKVWYFNGTNPTVQANWSSGSASPSPGNQTPGSFNNAANAAYIAQFNNGCQPITPLTVTATAVNAGCTCNGSATANASGSIGGYTYVWYDALFNPIGQTNATATGLCPGVYKVIATSHIGCTDTVAVTITSSSSTSVAVNSQSICKGNLAILTASPSAAGGTFSWSPGGQTTSSVSVSPLANTSYSVTYTLGGCATMAIANVTVTPNPTVSVIPSSICAGQAATLTASGATTYAWSTGAVSNPLIASPLSTTVYTVSGTTAGCTGTVTTTVTVNPSPTITVNSSTICAGQAATLTANGAATYTWDNGSTVNPLIISPTIATNYTVTGTLAGCTNTAVANVTANSSPTITVNSPTICTGQSATLTANGATTYTWNTASNSNSITVSPTSMTNYTVAGTVAGCSNTIIATVDVSALPAIAINTVTICAGQAATLTANGASTYTWSTGSVSNSLTVSPGSTSNYTVTGSSVAGCTNSSVGTVTVNPSPTVTVNSSTICAGQMATLTANGAATYSWSNGTQTSSVSVSPSVTTTYSVTGTLSGCSTTATTDVVVNSVSLTVNSPGVCAGQTATLTAGGAITYTWSNGATTDHIMISPVVNTSYTVTGSTGICTNSVVASVTINPTPSITVNSATICAGQSATLIANGATSYTWNTGSVSATVNVSPMVTTAYSVTGVQTGCVGSTTANVTVLPSPTVSVNSVTTCAGQTATLMANGAAVYSWSDGSTTNSLTASPGTTTNYTVTGTNAGCSSAAIGTINVTALPAVSISSSSICAGQTATLSANGAATYSWSNGALSNVISITPVTTTTYVVTGTISNCSASATGTVYVNPLPVISFNANTYSGCAPLCVDFSDISTVSSGSISNWYWSFGNGTTSTLQDPGYCYADSGSYTVGLTVTTSGGCSASLLNNNMINVFETPKAEFTSDVPGPESFDPTVQFINLSSNASSYYWSFGDSYASTEVDPLHPFVQPGVYSTTLIATSSPHNCKDTVVHEISVQGLFTFYAPNAFTPNNDRVNDVFLPLGTGWDATTYKLSVFDRWGKLCFSTQDALIGWDGKNGNDIAQIDTYTWKVQIKDIYGKDYKYIGRVTILK